MFRIHYEVRNSHNRNPEVTIVEDTLGEAVDSYCPDADLFIQIGEHQIKMDVCRDMYGFYEYLIDVIEELVFDLPSRVGYPEILTPVQTAQRAYGIMVTETYSPRLLVFLADGKYVYFQTRTLEGGTDVTISNKDVTIPVPCLRKDVTLEACSFLKEYMIGLVTEIPIVEKFDDYKAYMKRLNKIQIQALDWE